MKKLYPTLLCVTVGVALIIWGVGLSTDAFSSPIFRSFWWISYTNSHDAMFIALPIGGTALLVGISYWATREEKTKLPR